MLLRILIVTALLAQGLVGEEVVDNEPEASEVESVQAEELRPPLPQPKVRGPDPAGDKIDLGPLGPLGQIGGPLGGPFGGGPPEAWQGDMPKIVQLDVKCEKNFMKVLLVFDKPFYGIVFSKGHYSNANCVHLPAGLGKTSVKFEVGIHACGTQGNTENGLYGYGADSGSGTYFENTIVVQYDPQVQEVWDQARKLRCTWHEQYEKAVTFRPFAVDMLDVVRADFAGDNVGCWMQIQVGKGPWASEVSGLVKIGQTMTMVLAIKEDDNKFDMLVRNCMAHDGKRAPIQLVDQRGCVTRSKLMSRFTKIKNFGASASVLSYAHFQAFKFPDSMEVHFQCTIQICRYQCPEQCASPTQEPDELYGPPVDHYLAAASAPSPNGRPRDERRARRATPDEQEEVGVQKIIRVVSTGDLTFSLDDEQQRNDTSSTLVFPVNSNPDKGYVCMTTLGFASTLMVLLLVLLVSCLLSAALYCKLRPKSVPAPPKHARCAY
ncbi:cuticlin-4-like [Neocloeon triangulifer]|uniref:cuticlin-4-like n=1 Tax=Neocloeon triangulifer TaxID=2078957 RepID=UPI00286F16C7|nr:cuticlin-4-like [Neocloeon triangulifer]